jgi:ribosomal protein S18 acetylase RimI-like enzyme
LKTGDSGQDATEQYSDPMVLGHLYVGPYMEIEPSLAFVLEDEAGVCGYVLGAFDSESFYRRFASDWLPRICKPYVLPAGDAAAWTQTEKVVYELFHPDIYYPDSFRPYPSHLHIDLLPRAQGQGNGRRMIETLLARLKAMGSPGVHLGMSSVNLRAEGFYRKMGFQELARTGTGAPHTLFLGRLL